jgi:hypothetical protein
MAEQATPQGPASERILTALCQSILLPGDKKLQKHQDNRTQALTALCEYGFAKKETI